MGADMTPPDQTHRTVAALKVFSFCNAMLFVLPVIVLYYKDRIGLDFQDFLIGEAIFAATVFAMEVPTGWFADVFGRRKSLMAGTFVAMLGFVVLRFADSFLDIAMANIVLGVGIALNSGCVSALMYDVLAQAGRTGDYARFEGARHGTGLFGIGFSAAIGGVLFQISPTLPLDLDIAIRAVALGALFFVAEPALHIQSGPRKHPLRDMLDTMHFAMRGHREVAQILILMAVVFCTTKIFLWAQQALVDRIGLSPGVYGAMIAGMYLVGGIIGHVNHRLNFSGGAGFLRLALILLSVLALAAATLQSVAGLVCLMLAMLVWGCGMPQVTESINHLVGPARRATILSTGNFMIQILFSATSPVFGSVSRHQGIDQALLWTAGTLALLWAASSLRHAYRSNSTSTGT